MPTSPPPQLTREPAVVAGYDVLTTLATGGFGRVLLVRRGQAEPIAMKRAHPHLLVSATVRASMVAEDAALRAITSPCVVRGVGLLDTRGELAVLTEYVHGVSLAYVLDAAHQRRETLPPSIVTRIGLDLCAALQATHVLGLAHADVNPRNVLLGVSGGVKLCDFGLACAENGSPLLPSLRGTAAYAAPETVLRGIVDRRSDVFSAGATLWEAYRGMRLFRGASEPETLRNVVERDAPPLEEGRPELSALSPALARALKRDPATRTGHASELARALGEQPVATRRELADLVLSWAKPELLRRQRAVDGD